MPDQPKYPRLGDRADLRIEITIPARQSYQRTRWQTAAVHLTDAEALEELEELEDVLRNSFVRSSIGERMNVRGRLRCLGVDVECELTRVTPDHVRCFLARVRRYDERTRQGSRADSATHGSRNAPRTLNPRLQGTRLWLSEWLTGAISKRASAAL